MTKSILAVMLLVSCLLFLIFSLSGADNSTNPKQENIYDEAANGDKQVADAIAVAGIGNKTILL
jgi:hypothetical protein